jgi:5-methylcytosine-specific restriction protein A
MPRAAKQFRRQPVTRAANDYASWYGEQFWRRRSKQQLAEFPLCAECQRAGLVTVATVADHIKPHRGNRKSFEEGALQSLCQHHHQVKSAKGG